MLHNFLLTHSLLGLSYPCIGEIIALRGVDGTELWRTAVGGQIFEMNCGQIDVNKDGIPDCLAAGRLGTLLAFDYRNGQCSSLNSSVYNLTLTFIE